MNYLSCCQPIVIYPFRLVDKLVIILLLKLKKGLYQAMRLSIRLLLILFLSATVLPAIAEDEEVIKPVPIYYQFPAKPPIQIDFTRQSEGLVSILQAEVALMSHDQAIIDITEVNLTMIKHSLRRFLSKQTMEDVNSVAGREELQKKSLAMINKILKEESGKDGIEALFFTSFILQ